MHTPDLPRCFASDQAGDALGENKFEKENLVVITQNLILEPIFQDFFAIYVEHIYMERVRDIKDQL
jgi:hypothetical protein